MAVPSILQGQVWKFQATGDHWLVTKVYTEVFASYAVLRKVSGGGDDLRRVKVERSTDGVGLPGFIFTQEVDAF